MFQGGVAVNSSTMSPSWLIARLDTDYETKRMIKKNFSLRRIASKGLTTSIEGR
jgi:hypothetical protein